MTEVPEHLLNRAQAAKEKAEKMFSNNTDRLDYERAVAEQQVVFVKPSKPIPPTPPPKNPELTADEREWLFYHLCKQSWFLDEVEIVQGIVAKLSKNP